MTTYDQWKTASPYEGEPDAEEESAMEDHGKNGAVVVAEFAELGTPEQLAELYGALAVARAGFTKIVKGRTVTITQKSGAKYTFDYAELEDSLAATGPALSAAGLCVLQPFGMAPGGPPIVRTILAHKGGARIVSLTELPSWEDMKGLGGNITYLRRYAYNAMLCLSADQDGDDMPETKRGEVAADSGPRRAPPGPAQGPRTANSPKEAPASAPKAAAAEETAGKAETPRWLNEVEKEHLTKLCRVCGDESDAQVIERIKVLTKGERPHAGHYQGLVLALKAQAAKLAQDG